MSETRKHAQVKDQQTGGFKGSLNDDLFGLSEWLILPPYTTHDAPPGANEQFQREKEKKKRKIRFAELT